jgi:hypothetical protein
VFHNGEWTCLKMGYQLIDPEDWQSCFGGWWKYLVISTPSIFGAYNLSHNQKGNPFQAQQPNNPTQAFHQANARNISVASQMGLVYIAMPGELASHRHPPKRVHNNSSSWEVEAEPYFLWQKKSFRPWLNIRQTRSLKYGNFEHWLIHSLQYFN